MQIVADTQLIQGLCFFFFFSELSGIKRNIFHLRLIESTDMEPEDMEG